MRWLRRIAVVDREDFESAYDALLNAIGVPPEEVSAGISELPSPCGALSIAADLPNGFFAARLHDQATVMEAFLITPSRERPRLGISVLSDDPQVPAALHAWFESNREADALPSFTTLACLLATDGAAIREDHAGERSARSEVEYMQQLLADQGDELRQVKAQLRSLKLHDRKASSPTTAPAIEWTLDALSQWCVEHEDHIVVLPRARAGAKKSRFEDPSLIYTALDILAGPYRELRTGHIDQATFNDILLPTGLRLEGSVAPSIAGEQGDAYFVTWAGRKQFMGLHLLKGGGRDERYCFRMYFFWDVASQRAVVGSMPAHLANSLS